MATTFKIHPAIGIARLGNSPEFFVGPEKPGDHSPPNGGYKDKQCRLKKQAAKFRIFRYENGVLQGEVTAANATITWKTHLANTKGAAEKFFGVFEQPAGLRNATIGDRNSLKIDPGERSLNGPNQSASFDTGSFMGVNVPLGEMRTDAQGCLLILGGSGNAGSPTNLTLNQARVEPNAFANHNEWYDDVSDGWVKASVLMNGEVVAVEAVAAWVICAPPKYAPAIEDIITLYDVLYQVAVDKLWITPPTTPSFGRDIFPILDRSDKIKWLYGGVGGSHNIFANVNPPGPNQDDARKNIAKFHRNPAEPAVAANLTFADMPKIWSDGFSATNTIKTTAALTKTQFANMQQWVAGNFTPDAPPAPETQITPEGLDRAALESCVGAAFFPGIETSWMTRDTFAYIEPFRLDASQRSPGDLTMQMAVPWQADFEDCADGDNANGETLLWWPAHRPLQVFPEDGSPQISWARELATSPEKLIQHFHRLGFVVQQGNQFLETERQPGCKNCYLIVDKSTFGQDEVEVQMPGTASFTPAYWVAVEGFSNSELQLNLGNLGSPPLVPTITTTLDPALNPNLKASQATAINSMLSVTQLALPVVPQDPSLQTDYQRFLYPFTISFDGVAGFNQLDPNQVVLVTLTASITAGNATRTAAAIIELTKGQNPYYLNVNPNNPNQPFWLSFDTRFFKAIAGQSRFGAPAITSNPADAPGFIANVLANLNNPNANLGGDTFAGLTQDEGASALEFLPTNNNGELTFNFALARVRLIGKTPNAQAKTVRVFFRLFQAQSTVSDFNEQTTYRFASDGVAFGHKAPLLGVQNDQNGQAEYVTVPCFATKRINLDGPADMDAQSDPPNAKDITVNPNQEVDTYFGCWLDINQPQQKFLPMTPPAGNLDGPWNGITLFSLNEAIIKAPHQCMIAEIRFDDTPVPGGATSATSDKLAQRNIAWLDGPNPGDDPSRLMPHPFEIQSSPGSQRPDELMIMWGNTPANSNAYFYLPALNAADILNLADSIYSAHRLTSDDPHTIKCPAEGVTFIPIPSGTARNAGLMTLDLSPGIRRGEVFEITVRQITEASTSFKQTPVLTSIAPSAAAPSKGFSWRSPLGAFQMTVNISTKDQLLNREERLLAWLRWILSVVPSQNRWHSVLQRYADQIAGRVRGFGGDPGGIVASPDGTVRGPESALCRQKLKFLVPLLLAVLLVLPVLAPVAWRGSLTAAAIILIVIVFAYWFWRCKPKVCNTLCALILGISVAVLILATLFLLDYGSGGLLMLLAVLGAVNGVLVIIAALRGCCGCCGEKK